MAYASKFIEACKSPIMLYSDSKIESIDFTNNDTVIFTDYCKESVNSLPDNIRHIFMYRYYFPNVITRYPSNLEVISYDSDNFDQPIDNLPDGVKMIIFGSTYNRPIIKFPKELLCVNFGFRFNSVISNFPEKLTCIIFGHNFNQLLPELPESLNTIAFGRSFSRTMPKLPDSLLKLLFHKESFFNEELVLPPNLIELQLGISFNKLIILPESLRKLRLIVTFSQFDNIKLPTKLTHLYIENVFNNPSMLSNLNNKLKYLIITNCEIKLDNLPNNLRHLCIINTYGHKLDNLPINLKYLKIHAYYSEQIILTKFMKTMDFSCSCCPIQAKLVGYYYLHNINGSLYNISITFRRTLINKHNHTIRSTRLLDLLLNK